MKTETRELELAIAHGDSAELVRLLEARPDCLNIRFEENIGLTPLMWACRNRHATIVEFLLQKGAGVNWVNRLENDGEGGNTALWFTAQGISPGTVPIARLLMDHGAEVDRRCQQQTTAFFMAVSWMHMELVQFLLSRGADPLLKDAEGKTALQGVRKHYQWLQTRETKTEEMKRFGYRAPRMISFLEKLEDSSLP